MMRAHRVSLLVAAAAGVGLALAVGCESRSPMRIRPPPVIQAQRLSMPPDAMKTVVVIPFYAVGQPTGPLAASDPNVRASVSWDSAALVANAFTESLVALGVHVIPPSDVETAFLAAGHPVPRLDPRASSELAAEVFGATSIALGKVSRFREREGSAAGSQRPASVAFEVSLHQVPSGRRLWTGRFDETQVSITAGILRAREYPGGGTRWLTATEFARWGASRAARSLATGS